MMIALWLPWPLWYSGTLQLYDAIQESLGTTWAIEKTWKYVDWLVYGTIVTILPGLVVIVSQ